MKKLKILIIDTNPIINIGFKSIFKNSVIFEVVAFTYKKNEINEIINQPVLKNTFTCPICYEIYDMSNTLNNQTQTQTIITTPCNHQFCHSCYDKLKGWCIWDVYCCRMRAVL